MSEQLIEMHRQGSGEVKLTVDRDVHPGFTVWEGRLTVSAGIPTVPFRLGAAYNLTLADGRVGTVTIIQIHGNKVDFKGRSTLIRTPPPHG